jgi:hypothetical protein
VVQPLSYLNQFTAGSIRRLMETVGFESVRSKPFAGAEGDGFLRVTAFKPVFVGDEAFRSEALHFDFPLKKRRQ